jgi:2-dehydropantoate 2-reductase
VKKIERVYLSGLGAVGCAYASIMQDNEPGLLKVIANRERIEKYKDKGVYINKKQYRFDFVEPEVNEDASTGLRANDEKADLIIISVKYHQLGQAIKDIGRFLFVSRRFSSSSKNLRLYKPVSWS